MHGHLGCGVVWILGRPNGDVRLKVVLGLRERIHTARLAHEIDDLATLEELLVLERHQNRVQTKARPWLMEKLLGIAMVCWTAA